MCDTSLMEARDRVREYIPDGQIGSKTKPEKPFGGELAGETVTRLIINLLSSEDPSRVVCFEFHGMIFTLDKGGSVDYLDKAIGEKERGATLSMIKDSLIEELVKEMLS